ncbi:MAG TPA: hypothetical protein VGK06_10655 [Methanosarcina sp.]|jgi:hypothetical protein
MPDKKCQTCGRSDLPLQKHHYLGRNYSPSIILVCPFCHFKMTYYQNKLPPERRSKHASKSDLEKFALISAGALLKVMSETLEVVSNELLEN